MTTAAGYLIVSIAGTSHALAIEDVHEVVATPAITRVPAAPEWVRGLAAVRGRLIPVVDPVAGADGAPRPPVAVPIMVIVGVSGRSLGVAVDRVERVVGRAAEGEEPPVLPPLMDVGALVRTAGAAP